MDEFDKVSTVFADNYFDTDNDVDTALFKVDADRSIFRCMTVAQIEHKMKQCIDEFSEYIKPNVLVSWNTFSYILSKSIIYIDRICRIY